jgi:hypothetical protein
MSRMQTLDGMAWDGPDEILDRAPTAAPPLDLAALLHPSDWERLPASLRARFAACHPPATYRGVMNFERSAIGVCFAWLSRLFGAPLPWVRATDLPVTVDVRPAGPAVVWSRRLSTGQLVRSVKLAGPGGTVIERTAGGLAMLLDISVEDAAMVFTSRGFFLAVGRWRVPIPALLTPGRCRVEHRAIDAARFRFTLSMVHPLWGTTFRQTGVFTDSLEAAR